MIKHFCDCCGKELKRNGKIFSWLCHLTDAVKGKMIDYVETDGVDDDPNDWCPTSGREDSAELCTKCYNKILILSVKEFFELKKKNI